MVAPIYAATIGSTSPCAVPAQRDLRADRAGDRLRARAATCRGGRQPYTEAEVRAAIGETRLVLELMGSRYADPAKIPFPEMLADSVNNYGLYVGPVVPNGLDSRARRASR